MFTDAPKEVKEESVAAEKPKEVKEEAVSPDAKVDNTKKTDEASTSDSKQDDKDSGKTSYLDYIQSLISEKLHLHDDEPSSTASSTKILDTVDFDGVMKKWKAGGFKNIITMVGAGISTCKYPTIDIRHKFSIV